jgi:hypothetical protein
MTIGGNVPDREPTLSEVLRRMEHTSTTLTSLSGRMSEVLSELKEARLHADATYARREVMSAWRDADRASLLEVRSDIEEIKKVHESDINWKRQMTLGLGTIVISSLVAIALSIFSFLATR